ncbi:unnamed protein product, partial [Rotaria sp. Silwood1]
MRNMKLWQVVSNQSILNQQQLSLAFIHEPNEYDNPMIVVHATMPS